MEMCDEEAGHLPVSTVEHKLSLRMTWPERVIAAR